MVRRSLVPALMLMLAAASGCQTTQPTLAPQQGALIEFTSSASLVPLYEVWNAQLVTVTTSDSQEPVQTVQDLGMWCDISAEPAHQTRQDAKYPFRFSVEIDRIPAGTSNVEKLTDASYAASYGSITAYDESPSETPDTHPVEWTQDRSDPSTPAVTVILSFKNGRRISTASRDFIQSVKIASGSSTSYGSRCPFGGAASARNFGDPSVAGSFPSFGLDVNTGDVVVVKARKDTNPSSSVLYTGSTMPSFGSLVYVSGKDITSSVVGKPGSSLPSEGVSFSFTVR
jgi:hypothetical protein